MAEDAEDTIQTSPPSGPSQVDTDALTRSAGRGALWQLLGGGWQTVVQLGASAVLARVLEPRDFGIMGMAVLARGLIARMGLLSAGAGVIAKKDVSQDDLSTAFWMRATLQFVMFIITFATASLVARFFNCPELTAVMRAVSFLFFFTAISATPATLLRKELRFGTVKIIEGAEFALQSGATIVFAVVFDQGYWALVEGMLIGRAVGSIATVVCARWLPSFRFSRESFRYMFRYAINGLGATLVFYVHANIDYLLVGKILGPVSLGFYEYAFRIPHMILNRVSRPVGAVLFPTLAKTRQSDERLAAGFCKMARYTAMIIFPLLGGLAVVARPAIIVLWSAKWLPITLPLQVLCLRSALISVLGPIGSVFLCKDRPDIPFKFGLCTLAFTFCAVGGLGWAFGIIGVASGMLVSVLPHLVLLRIAFGMLRMPVGKFFRSLVPPLVSAVVSSAVAFATVHLLEIAGAPIAVCLMTAIVTGGLGYVGTMFWGFRETVQDVGNVIRIVIGGRRKKAKI